MTLSTLLSSDMEGTPNRTGDPGNVKTRDGAQRISPRGYGLRGCLTSDAFCDEFIVQNIVVYFFSMVIGAATTELGAHSLQPYAYPVEATTEFNVPESGTRLKSSAYQQSESRGSRDLLDRVSCDKEIG